MKMRKLVLYSVLFFVGFCNKHLDYRYVCDSYFECVDEKDQLMKMCEDGNKKTNEKCLMKMSPDFKAISKFENSIRMDTRHCVETAIKEANSTIIVNPDKNRFCEAYLFNRTDSHGDCSIRIGRTINRCEALRRCCEPATRCEQSSMYGENGRTLTGLKEEVDIKMAECAQHELELHPSPTPKSTQKSEATGVKKQKKVRVIESPPFSLCLKYLECQKDAHHMRVNCSKSSNPTSIDALDSANQSSSVEFDSWTKCRSDLLEDFYKMNERRDEAFSYLDKCVPIANVTREFMITDRVCRASALKQRKQIKESNCHVEVAKKRKECALLRDCCVQADVCERSALYAVISDEYLLRRTQLRENLESCMSRQLEESNSV